jgi:hypothetical protein
MGKVQKHNICINVPSLQIAKCWHFLYMLCNDPVILKTA